MTISIPIGTMTHIIPTSGVIVVIADVADAFIHAHHALIDKFGTNAKVSDPKIVSENFKSKWFDEYNITVVDNWFALEFASDQDLTAFLLRWS